MKTIKQLHDEEQREARIVETHAVFVRTMQRLENDHWRAQARLARTYRMAMWTIWIMFGIMTLVPIVVLWFRHW